MLAALGLAACASAPVEQPAPVVMAGERAVTVMRDEYGVPHVYAQDIYGLFFGYGYAVAQDRLFQMEMGRRSTQGQVAQVLGPDYLAFDTDTRRGFHPASIRAQMQALGANDQAIFEGYAQGMNAWIKQVQQAPEQYLPREFIQFEFAPSLWSAYDVVMMFVGTLANRYADFNTELENAKILRELSALHGTDVAARVFDQLNPRTNALAPTTIPATDWSADSSEPPAPPSALLAQFAAQSWPSAERIPHSSPVSGASNCWVLGSERVSGANAILVNGPQFGWFAPSYVYSVGLHGAGFEVVGNTPFGLPALLFAHNQKIAWGSTWGAGDMVDVFSERLNPANDNQYWHNGGWREYQIRQERIDVRGEPARTVQIKRSVHGQVVLEDVANGWAYAKQRSWDGREVASLLAWVHSMRAQNWSQWIEQAGRNALNINWYYADVQGNAGYAFTGAYPQRHEAHDNRLPINGEGAFDWRGIQDFSRNPQILNPTGGIVANWNNKPAQGVLNPDEFWYSWSQADRIDVLHEALAQRERFSAEQAWALIEHSSYADVHAAYFVPLMRRAEPRSALERLALAELEQWDWQSRDRDSDGYYDSAATAIFRTFLQVLIEDVLADDLGPVYSMFAATGYPAPNAPTAAGVNIQTGTKAIVEALLTPNPVYDLLNGEFPEAQLGHSLRRALSLLADSQGKVPADWRLPAPGRPYLSDNFLKVPQASGHHAVSGRLAQNRGTENNMFVLGRDGIVGWEVTPPGQSGFVAPDGSVGAHNTDQLAMYDAFGRKRMWFTQAEVQAHAVSTEQITY